MGPTSGTHMRDPLAGPTSGTQQWDPLVELTSILKVGTKVTNLWLHLLMKVFYVCMYCNFFI